MPIPLAIADTSSPTAELLPICPEVFNVVQRQVRGKGKENPLIRGKVGALGLMEVPADTLTLQICSAGRSISSSSLPLWRPGLLPLTSTLLSFNQTDFNRSVVPPVRRRRFASLYSVPFSSPCRRLVEMEQTVPCARVRGRDPGHRPRPAL